MQTEETTSQAAPRRIACALLLRAVEDRAESMWMCCATQEAIDRMAAEFGRGRRHFLDVLAGRVSPFDDRDLSFCFSEAWSDSLVTLALGRSREWWLGKLNDLWVAAGRPER